MKPKAALAALAAALACLPAARAGAQTAAKVIELFTSQGCSSCPPADRLAAEMAREPGAVVISMPVDYWDYLGWKDSFASPAFTARQKAYAEARGDMQVYTPQAVVDGVAYAVGSEADAIATAVRASRAPDVPIAVGVVGGVLHVEVGAKPGATPATLWLVPVLSSATVAVGRGENGGKSLTYTNIARGFRRLGAWGGTRASFEVPTAEISQAGADGAALLLQVDKGGLPGPILGAAMATLK
jgi:hypothetical protein